MILPALSIRQPWAWLIANRMKPVENRTWATKFRGPFFIHAAKGMTAQEYFSVFEFLRATRELRHIKLPAPDALERGGIVGRADLTDCVTDHPSPFFFGPFGLVMAEAKAMPFLPIVGRLGFFSVDYPDSKL